MTNKLVLVLGPWALWIAVTDVGRPYGQPALVFDGTLLRGCRPSGFDQAQGRGL